MEYLKNYTLDEVSQILGLKKSQVSNIRHGQRELSALEVMLCKRAEGHHEINFFDWSPNDGVFWFNLEALQSQLNFSDQALAQLLRIELRKFRFARARKRSLPHKICQNFLQAFELTPEILFCKSFDPWCLAQNILSPFHSNAYLPKRFEGGGSKMKTLKNAFSYVETAWDKETALQLKRSMQVSEKSTTFVEKEISIRIFSELHQRLRRFGALDRHFIDMGSFNKNNLSNKKMYSQIMSMRKYAPHIGLDYFFRHLVQSIDNNVHFKVVKSTAKEFILESLPGKFFKNAFSPHEEDSGREIGLYRLGHIKVIPGYFDYPELNDAQLEYFPETGRCVYSYKF